MRILQLQLYFFMWCQAGETLTYQVTDLGGNETINCDLHIEEVSWLLLKLPDPPVMIGKFFSKQLKTFLVNKTFKQKYSMQFRHLIIHNITIEDFGDYYCTNLETTAQFSAGTRLQIMVSAPTLFPASTEYQNHTEVDFQQNQTLVKNIQYNKTPWRTLSIISALLNVFLIFVVIGLVKMYVLRNKTARGRSQICHDTDQKKTKALPQESTEPQYAEVNFSKLRKPSRQSQLQSSTYAALKLPKS